MLRKPLLKLVAILFTLLAVPALATAQENKWVLRVNGIWTNPSVDFESLDDDETLAIDAEDDYGLSLALERRITRRFGIEVGALATESSFGYEFRPFGDDPFRTQFDSDFRLFTAGLNVHLTPNRATDLYIGPLFAYVDFEDATITQSFRDQLISADLRSSDDFALGAQIGADIPLGKGSWGLNFSARYIDSSIGLSLNDGPETQVDFAPLMLGAGVGFRF